MECGFIKMQFVGKAEVGVVSGFHQRFSAQLSSHRGMFVKASASASASASAYSNLSNEVNGSVGLNTIRLETAGLYTIREKNGANSGLFSRHIRLLEAVDDEYDGVVIDSERLPENPATFIPCLRASLQQWRSKGKKGVWLKLPRHRSDLVPVAVKEGFEYHHAEKGYVMLTYWIPDGQSMLPANASHSVGVGGFVINDNNEVLVLQEKYCDPDFHNCWKLPTGYINESEEIYSGAVREVKEETGIDTEFVEVIAFSPNVSTEKWQSIEGILGIRRVEKHAKYLGLPITFGRNKQDNFREIEDRIIKKTTDWKTKFLSRAGKEILIKSVLQSLPIYAMQVYQIPKNVCERMSKKMISFFWAKHKQDRSTHWINKDILFTNKSKGGLGLRNLESLNGAMLLKQAWRLISQPDSLVSIVIKSKYFPSASLREAPRGSNSSYFWNSLFKIKDILFEGVDWTTDNGTPRWSKNSSGTYCVKSGYDLIMDIGNKATNRDASCSNTTAISRFWRGIWSARIPPRIRLHAWRAFHNSLPDGINLLRRCGFATMPCGWCGWKTDSILHLTRDCWAGKLLGSTLNIDNAIYSLCDGNFADWLFASSLMVNRVDFRSLLCSCWVLWIARNDYVHNHRLWTIEEMANKVRTSLSVFDCGNQVQVGWHLALASSAPSPTSVFCDGSWKWLESEGRGAAGWSVVCLAENKVVAINAGFMPSTPSPDHMEGVALLKSLSLGASLNLTFATFFTDSVATIRTLALGAGYSSQPPWLSPCLQMLKDHPDWKIEWIHRDQNLIADLFSKKARRSKWSWSSLDAIPFHPSLSMLI